MKTVLIDSSFYIALVYTNDTNHLKAKKLVPDLAPTKYTQLTTEDFLKETLTTISQRVGKAVSIDFYNALTTNTQIISVTPAHFHEGLQTFLEPNLNKNISLVDCIASIVCRDIRADAIVTFDSHFRRLKLKTIPA